MTKKTEEKRMFIWFFTSFFVSLRSVSAWQALFMVVLSELCCVTNDSFEMFNS